MIVPKILSTTIYGISESLSESSLSLSSVYAGANSWILVLRIGPGRGQNHSGWDGPRLLVYLKWLYLIKDNHP